jgi:hypothetical protein
MSKHPTPWTFVGGILQDRDENAIAQVYTDDPETRAVLLHAAEMWEALKAFRDNSSADSDECTVALDELTDEIESEIAARKP